MSRSSIEWNQKADRFTSPLQRDAYERGEQPRKLDGRLTTDANGVVWFVRGEDRRIIGYAPPVASERDLDERPAPAKKTKRKRK